MQTAKRILLVEDDMDDQLFFVEALNKIHPSIQCDIAYNGKEALKRLSTSKSYDIIFMDINMPVMDGITCLERLKESDHNKIPVVMLTTSSNPNDIKLCKDLGAAFYCVKPTSHEVLFKELKAILTKGVKFHTL